MECVFDHGIVPIDLAPLVAAVRAIEKGAWVYRVDPESFRTCVVTETSRHFPARQVAEVIGAAIAAHMPPGYQNRLVLSCVPRGVGIASHRDDFGEAVRAASYHCHIPLITDERTTMSFPEHNKRLHLERGHLYSMDETAVHMVDNDSDVDRVHLLFAHFPHDRIGRGRNN